MSGFHKFTVGDRVRLRQLDFWPGTDGVGYVVQIFEGDFPYLVSREKDRISKGIHFSAGEIEPMSDSMPDQSDYYKTITEDGL